MKLSPAFSLPGGLAFGRDIAVALLLLMVVLLMVLPLPTPLVDALIGLNFGIAILLLMTAILMESPLALSSLPGIILISTLFRLSLSITTTRLILAEGNAGAIVASFGKVVIAGNLVVGMVVFFIITIVQFIVIAKGAERIAEVGARFTLDALPGKQMSIDAELRTGDIDTEQARGMRKVLERESQFYGAMDGAMKFVKGDAIAGLIIIMINLVGGLLVGMAQRGMAFGDAARTYSLLTVGDALVSQIPALFVAITAAVIVTRVKGDGSGSNLGSDIFHQVASNRTALWMAAATLCGMALLPGFPTAILFAMAAVFGGAGLVMKSQAPRGAAAPVEDADAAPDGEAAQVEGDEPSSDARSEDLAAALHDPAAPVELSLSSGLWTAFVAEDPASEVEALRQRMSGRIGMEAVGVSVAQEPHLEGGQFRLLVSGAPVYWSSVDLEKAYVDRRFAEELTLLELPFETRPCAVMPDLLEVDRDRVPALAEAGIEAEPSEVTALREIEDALMLNYGGLIGIEETKKLLEEIEPTYPLLVAEALRMVPIQRTAEVFSRLVEEGVSVRNLRTILQTLIEWGASEGSALGLTEYCRIALRQQICEAAADRYRVLTAIIVERSVDDMLRNNLRETGMGTFLVLEEAETAALLSGIRAIRQTIPTGAHQPVIVTSMDVRRHLRTFLKRNGIHLDVMSFQELSDDYTVVPCTTFRLSKGQIEAIAPIPSEAQADAAGASPQRTADVVTLKP